MYFIPNHIKVINTEYGVQIVNNLNKAEIELEEVEYINELSLLLKSGTSEIKSELEKVLFEEECLIDSVGLYRICNEMVKALDEVLFFTIMPTESCNFRCIYCYKKHTEGKMSVTTINAIKEFALELINKHKFRMIHISWFGGEPTLCTDIIKEINSYMIDLSKKIGAKFSSAITTNGYLLNRDMFVECLKLGINVFQITVDGYNQDTNRRLVNGQKTLDRILDNIKSYKTIGKDESFDVIIRNNILADNKDFKWYDFISGIIGIDKRFSLSVCPVSKLGGENDGMLKVIEKNSDLLQEHINYIKSLGIRYSEQVTQEAYSAVCNASYPFGFAFRENGDICKCTIGLNYEKNIVGKIDNNGHLVIFDEVNYLWSMDRFHGKCLDCKNGAICLNKACPYRLLKGGSEYRCTF